ncbi:porin [Vogesella sp. LIG4]|uniref:porin n=1 Tax=Vogesella sp. LIG4 TaxID=1192162 RepID=UPI0008200689|nr:porin [Vogesella sp. LIG4]SCK28600.1 Outer membrane protein (porin) [Vogesella sp. LIG4]
MLNKKLLAVAVAASAIAPYALADVTIYGTINESIESVQANGAAGAGKNLGTIGRVSSNVSKLGFKGTDDLGNGLKGIWQIEQEVSVDDGGSRKGVFASRNSFVGLNGQFGTFLMGNNDTVYKSLVKAAAVNPMGDSIADVCTSAAVFCRGDARLQNSVHYVSPVFAGLQAGVSYGFDELRAAPSGSTSATDKSIWSYAVAYNYGAFNAGLGYDYRTQAKAVAGDLQLDQSFLKAMASYLFETNTKVGIGFEQEKDQVHNASDKKQNAWQISAEQKFGNFGVNLAYSKLDESKGGAKDGATQWTLGSTYDLSKRTQVYAYYTRIDNQDNATRTFGNAGLSGIAAGSNPTGVGAGMKVSF